MHKIRDKSTITPEQVGTNVVNALNSGVKEWLTGKAYRRYNDSFNKPLLQFGADPFRRIQKKPLTYRKMTPPTRQPNLKAPTT
ncbi:hypothetical protein BH09BAC4_BH09BAC4_31860 [soil metagenome]